MTLPFASLSVAASCSVAPMVRLDVPGYGEVVGDVAWGGNWFFLVEAHDLAVSADAQDAQDAHSQIEGTFDDGGHLGEEQI